VKVLQVGMQVLVLLALLLLVLLLLLLLVLLLLTPSLLLQERADLQERYVKAPLLETLYYHAPCVTTNADMFP